MITRCEHIDGDGCQCASVAAHGGMCAHHLGRDRAWGVAEKTCDDIEERDDD